MCEYCDEESVPDIVSSDHARTMLVNADVSAYVIDSHLCVDVSERVGGGLGLSQTFIGRINFCPMCGRKLAGGIS